MQSATDRKDAEDNIERESLQLLEWPEVCRQARMLHEPSYIMCAAWCSTACSLCCLGVNHTDSTW